MAARPIGFSTADTIVAIATPPGRGAIGVVRVSGDRACAIVRTLISHEGDLEPRRATYTTVRLSADAAKEPPGASGGFSRPVAVCDQVVVTHFRAPHSYTGEDLVEISAHGSPVVLRSIVEAAVAGGARLAEPGEFTLRAFLNGRIDLPQAEAVADLIEAATPLQARVAFDQLEGTLTETIAAIDASLFDLIARLEASVDFPEEGYHFAERHAIVAELDALLARTCSLVADARRGRLIREGLQVALVGAPNVGKSTLFNALVGAPRAIVTDVPGTTRDLLTESVDVHGVRVTFVDTAGLRETNEPVEVEGVSRSLGAASVADLVLVVIDDERSPAAIHGAAKNLIVQNKIDLGGRRHPGAIAVSALTGEGLDSLRRAIVDGFESGSGAVIRDRPQLTNIRHASLVQRAHDALARARSAVAVQRLSEEFALQDLQEARAALEEITGRRAPEDLLVHIFSRFCIGK